MRAMDLWELALIVVGTAVGFGLPIVAICVGGAA